MECKFDKEPKPKSVGSGVLSALVGVLILAGAVFPGQLVEIGKNPRLVVTLWCVSAGTLLLVWGAVRITLRKNHPWVPGQPTITFVITALAATFALLSLVNPK